MNVRILISAMLCFLLIGYGVKLQAEPTESLPVEAGDLDFAEQLAVLLQ